MTETTLSQVAGWSAWINGITSIASTVTLILMFAVAVFFGPINDAISVIWALSFIPLAVFFYRLNQPANAPLSLATAVIGVAAMLVFAVSQTLLVLRVVRFEQTLGLVLLMGAIIGLWAAFNGFLARGNGALPGGLIWLLIIFGVSFVFTAVGWYQAGQQHPLTAAGFLIGAIAGSPVVACGFGIVDGGMNVAIRDLATKK